MSRRHTHAVCMPLFAGQAPVGNVQQKVLAAKPDSAADGRQDDAATKLSASQYGELLAPVS